MRSSEIIREVSDHLQAGREAKLYLDKTGRRFVKLVKWGGLFATKYELTGAAAVSIEHMLSECRHRESNPARQSA